jgi:hypothetical protein
MLVRKTICLPPAPAAYRQILGLRVAGELAGRSGTGKTFPACGPATIDDRATVLRGHAGKKTELADTTLLRGLERSFHVKS